MTLRPLASDPTECVSALVNAMVNYQDPCPRCGAPQSFWQEEFPTVVERKGGER